MYGVCLLSPCGQRPVIHQQREKTLNWGWVRKYSGQQKTPAAEVLVTCDVQFQRVWPVEWVRRVWTNKLFVAKRKYCFENNSSAPKTSSQYSLWSSTLYKIEHTYLCTGLYSRWWRKSGSYMTCELLLCWRLSCWRRWWLYTCDVDMLLVTYGSINHLCDEECGFIGLHYVCGRQRSFICPLEDDDDDHDFNS